MAENKKFSVRTDGTGQNVFVSDVFLLSVPEEERVKALSINDDGRVVLTSVSGSGGGTVDTGSLLNNASVSSNTITFTRGNATTFNLTVDTGSGGTTNTGSLITTSSVSLNTITFTKGDASTFDITVDTGSDEFTGTVTSVGGTGTVNGITLSGTVTTSGNLSLGGSVSINNSNWSGTDLSVANGGTGASTFTSNALLTGNGTSAIQSENNLTFNGSTLTVTGGITATIGTGTDNSVVVKNSSNQLVTDEIDPKVWAGNLVDKQGTPVQYQVATFNDSDTLVGSSNLTFDNSTLSITGNVTATSFTGSLSGSATTAVTSTTADTASKITIDPVTSTDTTTYPVLVDSNNVGAKPAFIDGGNLSYNASTNTLTTTTFNGNLTGNASQAETASLAINANSSSITDEDGVEGSYYVTFVDNTSGYNNLKVDSNTLTYNPGSNTLTANIFAGSLSGNASTATTATNATSASYAATASLLEGTIDSASFAETASLANNIKITANTSTDTTTYPVLVGANTATGQAAFIDNANLSYNASTNTLTATTFNGALTGNAATATSASHADNASQAETASLAINANSSSITDEDGVEGSYYVTFVDNTSGYNNLKVDSNTLTYNPVSNTLTADVFNGTLTGNASTATTATTATTANTASKITIDPVTSTDTTAYPVLVGNNSVGAQSAFIDNANLSYNASTNTLTATTFNGALTGNASTATTASYANKLNPNAWYKEVGTTITNNKDTTNTSPGFLYPMDSSTGTITFTLNAGGAGLSGGEEWDFFVLDLTNQIDFTAIGGESVISENGLKANSTGSAIVAKFVGNIGGTNTWALVGSLQP